MPFFRFRLLSAAWLAALALAAPFASAAYRGYVVMDAATGTVLAEENADVIAPPASVTKLMSYLIVHDALASGRLQLTTPVTANAVDQSMGGTQVHIAAGETFPVDELLRAVLVESANDAAHALVIPAAGSREGFVAAMNSRARALGMNNTTWRTPHGLPPASRNPAEGDLTTARDLALLARELVSHTDVLRYTSLRTATFGAGVRAAPQPLRNHNKLLVTVPGCDGLKTGYTAAAGFCLVATAQRDGKRVIVTILGSPDAKTRDAHVARLIEEGLAKIPADSLFIGGPVVAVAPVAVSPVGVEPAAAPTSATPVNPAAAPVEETPSVRFVLPARR